MSVEHVSSLDGTLGKGAEALIATARRRWLLNNVAVGVVRDGRCLVRTIGPSIGIASRFELGSLTKTYTAELLAIQAYRGVVKLDDPVSKYLKRGAEHGVGPESITFEDLATHCSGLRRLPPGLPFLSLDPYARYGAAALEAYSVRHGLQRPPKRGYRYSNLGYSLLGYALGQAAGMSYAELLQQEILDPLGMTDTALALGQTQPLLVRGHRQSGIPTPHWRFDVCAPCGGLCSTIVDQVRWLHWLLEDVERDSFQRRAKVTGGDIGLGWMMPAKSGLCWHNGATAGFSSWLSLDRNRKTGVVILSDRQAIGLINVLGSRFQRCLAGGDAGEIGSDYGRAKSLLLDPLQMAIATLSPLWSRS